MLTALSLSNSAPVLFVLMAIVTLYVLLRSTRRRASGSGRVQTKDVPELPTSRGHHLSAPREFLQWEVAMHETARDLSAELDSKVVLLEQLLQDARDESARLERLLRSRERVESGEARFGVRPASARARETK